MTVKLKQVVSDYSTDGCTGVKFDGEDECGECYYVCCVEHDFETRNPSYGESMLEAHNELRKCAAKCGCNRFDSWLLFGGAFLFGWIPWVRNRQTKDNAMTWFDKEAE